MRLGVICFSSAQKNFNPHYFSSTKKEQFEGFDKGGLYVLMRA